jgi:hypothetical protein
MGSFDAKVEKACKEVSIPGAVLVASSADGKPSSFPRCFPPADMS